MARNWRQISMRRVCWLYKKSSICKFAKSSVKKFDEVLGMITFANELISHMNQMGVAVEKEKTKRATLAQTEAEGDKLQVWHF